MGEGIGNISASHVEIKSISNVGSSEESSEGRSEGTFDGRKPPEVYDQGCSPSACANADLDKLYDKIVQRKKEWEYIKPLWVEVNSILGGLNNDIRSKGQILHLPVQTWSYIPEIEGCEINDDKGLEFPQYECEAIDDQSDEAQKIREDAEDCLSTMFK